MEESPGTLPKRVILFFKMDDPDQDIVHAFLRFSNRQENEYYKNKHAVHLDPGRHEHEPGTYLAHLVIDMDANDLKAPDLVALPHEIYKVKHDTNRQISFRLIDRSKNWRYYEEVLHFTKELSWNFEADRRRHQLEDQNNDKS